MNRLVSDLGKDLIGLEPLSAEQIRTILDNSLRDHHELWAGAGDHHSMFSITYKDLRRITDAEELDVR